MVTHLPGWLGPRRYDWIIEGKLAASSYPRDDDHLRALHTAGVRALVTLHERACGPRQARRARHSGPALPGPRLRSPIAGSD